MFILGHNQIKMKFKNYKVTNLNIVLLIALFILQCKNEKVNIVKNHNNNPYLDAIYNSASADNPNDSSHIAKILLEEPNFNFGTIFYGDTFVHNFKFTNTGNARLLITEISGTCGCTKAEFPKGFILPQDTGIIKITYIPNDKIGEQDKPISITANTKPNITVIQFKGLVRQKKLVK